MCDCTNEDNHQITYSTNIFLKTAANKQIYKFKIKKVSNWSEKNIMSLPSKQSVSQDLEIGCPNLLEISKQGVQIVHLQYFYM